MLFLGNNNRFLSYGRLDTIKNVIASSKIVEKFSSETGNTGRGYPQTFFETIYNN